MAEGVMTADGAVTGEGVWNDPKVPPPDDPAKAPKGWMYDHRLGQWRAKRSGPRVAPKTDEPGDEPQRDPAPGWAREEPKPKPGKVRFEDVPKKVRDDVAGFAGMAGLPLLAVIQQADPYCGGALAQSYQGIVDACLPLICRSERVIAFFSGESDWPRYLALAIALRPVAQAVVQHHVLRTVEVVRDEHGVPHAVPRSAAPPGEFGDHLTPSPQPEPFDYAA